MKTIGILSISLILLAGCASNKKQTTHNPTESGPNPTTSVGTTSGSKDIEGMSMYALGDPIRSGNMAIVPVVLRKQAPDTDQYITLGEAKKQGWIEIVEVPGDEQVDTLQVRNSGPKPLLLLAGELLLGGKQDRVVAKDTIVPPGKTVDVPVFCVEPGRWTGSSMHFEYGDTTVPTRVKKAATYGEQQEVWANVRGYNSEAKASAGASTLQAGISQKAVQERVQKGLKVLRDGLKKQNNVVGVMFVIDGQIQTLEMFGSSRLFDASVDGLLKGFLADAAVAPENAKNDVSLKTCGGFVKDSLNQRRQLHSKANGAYLYDASGEADMKGVELRDGAMKSDATAGGAAEGLVHGTYSKDSGKR